MPKYTTPGVYIDETPGFPPSVNEEPTSTAVFIGYTGIVTDADGNDITLKPISIKSFLEYTTVFGSNGGTGYLFDAVHLFYNNGGNNCYVISAGNFNDAVSFAALNTCLDNSKNVQAQLLIIPDACLLPANEFSALQQLMLQYCAVSEDRFAILDTMQPSGNIDLDLENFRTGIGNTNLKWGAAYYPWLILPDNKTVPPAGAIAGAYAKVDTNRGVWKTPANISLNGIKGITTGLTDRQQEIMNIDAAGGKSVNAIRQFTGKGILIWGARTLAGNDNEWRYVPVRRLITMVEQSVKKSTAWAVFEPNHTNTWVKIKALVSNYLTLLWRKGALQGTTTAQAFFVNAGLGTTMTTIDILEGRLIVEIGLAVVRPAEFIILRFSHKIAET